MTLPRELRGPPGGSIAQNSVFSWPISGTMDLAPTNCRVEEVNTEYQLENGDPAPVVGPGPKEEGGGHSIPRAAVPSSCPSAYALAFYCVASLAPGWASPPPCSEKAFS